MMDLEEIEYLAGVGGTLIDRLFDDFDALVEVVAADGWPEAMVREGFRLHRRTWRVDDLLAAAKRELSPFLTPDSSLPTPPTSIVHIWPTLPGAGLTPVLFGALLGAEQSIRPSREAGGFARYLRDVWYDLDAPLPPLELLDSAADWTFGDVVVVSGSDETIAAVEKELHDSVGGRRTTVTGYGHRVSFGVVPADTRRDPGEIAADLARDAVLWHQQGCLSLRAVVVVGDRGDAEAFAEPLGAAIAEVEEELDAHIDDEGALARRAQARSVADIAGRRFGDGVGWAEVVDEPFDGSTPATQVVTCHAVEGADALDEVLALPAHHLQGVALAEPDDPDDRSRWHRRLADLGATRICAPGDLQAPPAGWWHDGRPNLLEWLRFTTIDGAAG